jgi:hypothetical protein
MADGGSNFSGKEKRVWQGSRDIERHDELITNQKTGASKKDNKSK